MRIEYWIGQLKKNYMTQNPSGLKTCLNTVKAYTGNAKNNLTDPKYHKIKKANKAFTERVAPFPEALDLLRACGFKDDEDPEFMAVVTSTADGFLLGECLKFVDLILGKL